MEHLIVAIKDRQLDAYMRPFTCAAPGQAIRSFRDEINRDGSDLNKHPEDYELHQLGTFNEVTGEIKAAAKPMQLAIATNLIERQT